MHDEKQLIIALRNDSHEAFHTLYDFYKHRVCRFIFNILGSYDETEEVFQSVFEKLWEHRHILDSESPIGAYIYKIAQNRVYDVLRQRTSRKLFEKKLSEMTEKSDSLSESLLHDRDFNQYLEQLVRQLPERRKEIFLLRYFHHLSYREIAEKLNITENTVDTQLRHAIGFLRTHVGKELFMLASIVLNISSF